MADKQIDDLNLPIAVVARIIKDVLPEGCNVSKEAKLALTRAATVFVLYMTSQANIVASDRGKKTISDADIIKALEIAEFENFEDELKESLQQYRQTQKLKKEQKQNKNDSENQDDDDDEEGEDAANADVVEIIEEAI